MLRALRRSRPTTIERQTAAEAPKAAAEVIGQLRHELSASMARDNSLLEERSRIMETLGALLDAINIIRNAITLAHALGNALPKVAILSAVETVTPKIPSTLDAAAQRLMSAGFSVVAAAGNSNADACTQSPARAPGIITVAASDKASARGSTNR